MLAKVQSVFQNQTGKACAIEKRTYVHNAYLSSDTSPVT